MKVRLFIQKEKTNKDREAPVIIRAYLNGFKPVKIATGVKVKVRAWKQAAQAVVKQGGQLDPDGVNEKLKELTGRVYSIARHTPTRQQHSGI